MHKKIAFIAISYIVKYDGISVYTENLLQALLKNLDNKQMIDVYVGKSALMLLKNRVLEESVNFIPINDNNFFIKMLHLTYKIHKQKYDLVFATNFMPLFTINAPLVKVIHDLSPEVNPKLYSKTFKYYHAFLLKSAKRFDYAIGYISNTTKNDLDKFYNINSNNKKLLYLPNGIPFKVQNIKRASLEFMRKKYLQDSLIFLIVGRINYAKGFDKVLDFCKFLDKKFASQTKFKTVTLKIAGKQTPQTKEILKEINFKHLKVELLGYVDDQSLNLCYQNAHFCFFLSKNEGYGLPLVEAMWLRSIPIISDIAIFNEIMGDKYPKFDIHSDSSKKIYKFICQIFQDKLFYDDIVNIIEHVVKKEQFGYNNAATNLIYFLKNMKIRGK